MLSTNLSIAKTLSTPAKDSKVHAVRFSPSGRKYDFLIVGIRPKKSMNMFIDKTMSADEEKYQIIALIIAPIKQTLSNVSHFPSPYHKDKIAIIKGPTT